MKIEDIRFPISVEVEAGDTEYKVCFDRRTWFIRCCDSKNIKGEIHLRKVARKIKGFRFNRDLEEWRHAGFFSICPVCGKCMSGTYIGDNIGIVRKAWLKVRDAK